MTSADVIEIDDEDPRSLYLSCPEMCRVAGVSYRKIDYWIRCGLVRPSIGAEGSGTQRRFDAEQVATVRVVALLVRMGIGHDDIRALVSRIENVGVEGQTFEPFPGVLVALEAVAENPAVPTHMEPTKDYPGPPATPRSRYRRW